MEREKGCTTCKNKDACPDAFSTQSRYCGSYDHSVYDSHDPMYIAVGIMYIDDSMTISTIIKADDVADQYDEEIFHYGMDLESIQNAMKDQTVFDNEWQIITVFDWSNDIKELLD